MAWPLRYQLMYVAGVECRVTEPVPQIVVAPAAVTVGFGKGAWMATALLNHWLPMLLLEVSVVLERKPSQEVSGPVVVMVGVGGVAMTVTFAPSEVLVQAPLVSCTA